MLSRDSADIVGSTLRAPGPPDAATIWHAIPEFDVASGVSSLGPIVIALHPGNAHLYCTRRANDSFVDFVKSARAIRVVEYF